MEVKVINGQVCLVNASKRDIMKFDKRNKTITYIAKELEKLNKRIDRRMK